MSSVNYRKMWEIKILGIFNQNVDFTTESFILLKISKIISLKWKIITDKVTSLYV